MVLWLMTGLAMSRTLDVHVLDHEYEDPDVTIELGDEVRWLFVGPSTHSATAALDQSEYWDTGVQVPGVFSAHEFLTEGSFVYYCSVHGEDLGGGLVDGMSGLVTVVAPSADSDSDGLSDVHEVWFGTDPAVADTDADGVLDGAEIDIWGSNPLAADTDMDGLDDGEETTLGTSPIAVDTDGDDLGDGDEVEIYFSDPLLEDTDLGGLDDGDEIDLGLNPLEADDDDGPMRLYPPLELVLGEASNWNIDNGSPLLKVFLVMGTLPGEFPVPGCPDLVLPFADPRILDRDDVSRRGRAQLRVNLPVVAAGVDATFVAVQNSTCRRSARELITLE